MRGDVEQTDRDRLSDPWYSINLAKLPEYIRIVESYGYTVTKNPDPVAEPVPDEVTPVPADGQPEDRDSGQAEDRTGA